MTYAPSGLEFAPVEHVARRETPTTYTVRYRCACGWVGTEVPSEAMGIAGAELVRHFVDEDRRANG